MTDAEYIQYLLIGLTWSLELGWETGSWFEWFLDRIFKPEIEILLKQQNQHSVYNVLISISVGIKDNPI